MSKDTIYKIETVEGSSSASYSRSYYYESRDRFEYALTSFLLLHEQVKSTNKGNDLARLWARLVTKKQEPETDRLVRSVKAAYVFGNDGWEELDFRLIPPKVTIIRKN